MSESERLYVIAGESSGDLHASNLMKAILAINSNISFRFWGGERMISVQDNCAKHIKELAFMGFWEVITNLRTILGNIKYCKRDILEYKPDAIVLVDYPGFNLRIAKWAKRRGIKVIYYVSPQIWAWKQSRVHQIKRDVDQMFVILPFEKDFYMRFGFEVEYCGHPLLDEIENFRGRDQNADFRSSNNLDERPIIAVLPGSRDQEIKRKLPIMAAALEGFDQFQVVVAGAPNFDAGYYDKLLPKKMNVVINDTYSLLSQAQIAVVTSGTATLETALFNVPEVVCYKGSQISYQIAKRLIKVKYISLVNLIMDKEIVKELIQNECDSENIRLEVDKLINDQSYREEMLDGFVSLRNLLGGGGASEKVAQSLISKL